VRRYTDDEYLEAVNSRLPKGYAVRLIWAGQSLELYNTRTFYDMGAFHWRGTKPEELVDKILIPAIARDRLQHGKD
jgi:hypothetical protein